MSKRFVKEFALYEIKTIEENEHVDPSRAKELVEKIQKIVQAFEHDMITPAEACWCIAEHTR